MTHDGNIVGEKRNRYVRGGNTGTWGSQSAMVLDPVTGYMETSGDYARAFDGDRKENFLKVYRANGLAFYKTCKDLSISSHTITHHVKNDPKFADEIKQAEREFAEELEAKSRGVALSKDSATLERIFHLRALFPDKYARDLKGQGGEKIEINVIGDVMISHKKSFDVVETDIVLEVESASTENPVVTVHQTPQTGDVSTVAHSLSEERTTDGRPY